jgi:hypothetical protein
VLEELGGEVAIIRHEDESGGRIFEVAHGIDTLRQSAEKIAECFAALGVGEGGDDFGRLVQEEIEEARGGTDGTTGGFDFVLGGIGFGAEFGDGFAVDADLAGEDELFSVAARGNAGTGDDLLEAFEHSRRISVIGYQISGTGEGEPDRME